MLIGPPSDTAKRPLHTRCARSDADGAAHRRPVTHRLTVAAIVDQPDDPVENLASACYSTLDRDLI
jgi:hypothetical protein